MLPSKNRLEESLIYLCPPSVELAKASSFYLTYVVALIWDFHHFKIVGARVGSLCVEPNETCKTWQQRT